MSPKLKALLVAVGVTVGGVVIYQTKPGVKRGDLVDAGVEAECTKAKLRCTTLTDAGYAEAIVTVDKCAESFVLGPASGRVIDVATCRVVRDKGPDREGLPNTCACRKKKGDCAVALSDGGTVAARFGTTLSTGEWLGPGCEPKACVEVAGLSSWPKLCPVK